MVHNPTLEDADDIVAVARTKAKTDLEVKAMRKTGPVGDVAGLRLCISPSRKSWRLSYRLPGQPKRLAIGLGPYPDVSVKEARLAARRMLKIARRGDDPKTVRERYVQAAVSVNQALDEYLAFCEGENRARTIDEKRIAFRGHIRPAMGALTLRNLDSGDWLKAIDKLGKRAGARRNLFAYTHHFLAWAKERKYIAENPLADVRAPKKLKPRRRALNETDVTEIPKLWALSSTTACLAKLALLTAQREASLGAIRWDQLDLAKRVWVIPGALMKSGDAHKVPLSDMAVQLLQDQPRLDGPYIFGVRSKGEKPFNGFSNGMDSLRKQLAGEESLQGRRAKADVQKARNKAAAERKQTQWRFHDLRRTAVTLAQEAGQPLDAIRALTQHKIVGVMGTYATHDYQPEMRAVVDAIERQIRQVLKT